MNKTILVILLAVAGIIAYLVMQFAPNIDSLLRVERREPVTNLQDYQPGSLTK